MINDQVQLTVLQYYNIKFHVTVLSDDAITMPHVCLMACVNLFPEVIDLSEFFCPHPTFQNSLPQSRFILHTV